MHTILQLGQLFTALVNTIRYKKVRERRFKERFVIMCKSITHFVKTDSLQIDKRVASDTLRHFFDKENLENLWKVASCNRSQKL